MDLRSAFDPPVPAVVLAGDVTLGVGSGPVIDVADPGHGVVLDVDECWDM